MAKDISGLSQAEAQASLKKSGPNIIFQPKRISFIGIFFEEVTEPMILLLLFVGLVYSFWGKAEDAVTIFFVIFLLVMAEVYNEYRAKRAIESLTRIAAPLAKVIRGGKIIEVAAETIAPGDILILSDGTKLSADAELVRGVDLQLDESALTGESYPAEKKLKDIVYAGTIVVSGEGLARVTVTGKNTRIGQIAKSTETIKPPKTPLQLAMKKLSFQLVYVALFFSLVIPLLGWLRGQDLKLMVLTGLSLAFAVIPEELPIVITMVLGLGAYKLSKNNFLVKKIRAAEILGNATVIVTDKTGTITSGQLTLKDIYTASAGLNVKHFGRLATTSLSLKPLDKLLRDHGAKTISDADIVRERNFTNEAKTNSLIRINKSGQATLYIKGAPEEIFRRLAKADKAAQAELDRQTAKGRRVIAVAFRQLAKGQQDQPWDKIETGLTLAGFLSFEDPLRAGVKKTIAQAKGAGIRTIMITGDNPATAGYIAGQAGIGDSNRVISGAELDKTSQKKLEQIVKTASVFARATPEHKYRIVQALQKNGEVVAVTGDGINDSLALKGADIGIAMGIRGTDVAKEAAEVILADDNYNTIAKGVFEGRKFFDNLRKGIKYYLSVKAALVMIFLLPVLLGIPLPLAPIQIILMELFMDLAASAGFVSEKAESDIFRRPPRPAHAPLIDRATFADILLKGATLFVIVTAAYLLARAAGWPLVASQTLAFSAWIFGHIALAFVSRSDVEPLYRLGLFSNRIINIWAVSAIAFLVVAVYWRFIDRDFGLAPISVGYFLLAAALAVALPLLLELKKIFFHQKTPSKLGA